MRTNGIKKRGINSKDKITLVRKNGRKGKTFTQSFQYERKKENGKEFPQKSQ